MGVDGPWGSIIKKCFIRKEALKRNQFYRNEFETAFQSFRESLPQNKKELSYPDLVEAFQISYEGDGLRHRWGLNFTLHPDDKKWDCSPNDAPLFFQDPGEAVKVISTGEKNDELIVKIELSASKERIEKEIAKIVADRKEFLITWEVLRKSKCQDGPPFPPEDLPYEQWKAQRNELDEQRLFEIRQYVEKQKNYKRRGKSVDDTELCFKVWDMHHKDGKSLLQIMGKLFPDVAGIDPNGDAQAQAAYQKIRRLYQRALEEIKKVKPLTK